MAPAAEGEGGRLVEGDRSGCSREGGLPVVGERRPWRGGAAGSLHLGAVLNKPSGMHCAVGCYLCCRGHSAVLSGDAVGAARNRLSPARPTSFSRILACCPHR